VNGCVPLLEDLGDVRGKRVVVRLDLNVPIEERDGKLVVADDFRIRAALPTLTWLLNRGAKVTVLTHLGRPGGRPDPALDLAPVRECLEELVPGVAMSENLRFSPGEEANDPEFVKKLIKGQDCYVNDAFGVSHRAHASIVGPPAFLPSAAGRLLAREIDVLTMLLEAPNRPFVVVVGGVKVKDKIGVLRALARKADALIVGGGMAYTFLEALGRETGDSIVDRSKLAECEELLRSESHLLLPVDNRALAPGYKLSTEQDPSISVEGLPASRAVAETAVVGLDVPAGWRGLDIGPATEVLFSQVIASAKTVLWNGPMGVFEDERFSSGTRAIAEAVASCPGCTVVGGGDSASALAHLGLSDSIDHMSTGGGASLALLEHGDLPGLAALRAAPNAPCAGGPGTGG